MTVCSSSRVLLIATLVFGTCLVQRASAEPIVFRGTEGPGVGTHLVLLAGDHEYRSEETIPALGRILATRHGFKCTVLITTDPETGEITPGSNHMPGTEALATADACVMFMRYQNLPAEQMDPIVAYLERGGPIVGLRTSTHAFKIPRSSPYAKYDEKYPGDDYKLGFGRQVLGETWVSHYGKNHKMSTRLDIGADAAGHPILTGITDHETAPDLWAVSGGYWVAPKEDATVLATCIPLDGMTPDSPVADGKQRCPGAWVRTYDHSGEGSGRVFCTTYGASEDIENEPLRRMVINATFWAAGLEDRIKPDLDVAFVGPYQPTPFGMNQHRTGVRPEELLDLSFPIMPADRPLAPGRKGRPSSFEIRANYAERLAKEAAKSQQAP